MEEECKHENIHWDRHKENPMEITYFGFCHDCDKEVGKKVLK